jgi:hypothetical protein
MLLICDYCGINSDTIFKIPSSAFYIEKGSLFSKNDYVNMCYSCLVHEKEKES